MTQETKTEYCESCCVPFEKDPLGNARESRQYCSYCFKDGALCYQGNDLKEFKGLVYKAMRARSMSLLKAKLYTHMIGFAPRWKK